MNQDEFDAEVKQHAAFRVCYDFLRGRKRSYQQAFRAPAGRAVLVDLARFCRVGETPAAIGKDGKIDVHLTYVAIGRQEVWLRIQQHLNLSNEQLMLLFQGKSIGEHDA